MDKNKLLSLRARLLAAKVNKHGIASAPAYTAALEKQAGPTTFKGKKHSAGHLLALVEKAIRVLDAPKPPPEKPKTAKASAAKAEGKAEDKTEDKAEVKSGASAEVAGEKKSIK
jgi:hypothetical protein